MIILDEEHESSYQSENPPRYHARDVAKFLCAQHSAVLVLGSATPSVESTFQAQRGVYQKLILRSRYNRQPLPRVVIADMREEVRAGNAGTISAPCGGSWRRIWPAGSRASSLSTAGAAAGCCCAASAGGPPVPPVQRVPDLPQRQPPADVPLLRPL